MRRDRVKGRWRQRVRRAVKVEAGERPLVHQVAKGARLEGCRLDHVVRLVAPVGEGAVPLLRHLGEEVDGVDLHADQVLHPSRIRVATRHPQPLVAGEEEEVEPSAVPRVADETVCENDVPHPLRIVECALHRHWESGLEGRLLVRGREGEMETQLAVVVLTVPHLLSEVEQADGEGEAHVLLVADGASEPLCVSVLAEVEEGEEPVHVHGVGERLSGR